MTLYCADCSSPNIVDLAAPWALGKIPTCQTCGYLLYDAVGAPLPKDAQHGWCHSHAGHKPMSWPRDRWVWKDAAAYPDAYAPLSETRELAAHAEPADPPLEQR